MPWITEENLSEWCSLESYKNPSKQVKLCFLQVLKSRGRDVASKGRNTDTQSQSWVIHKNLHIKTAWTYCYWAILCKSYMAVNASIDNITEKTTTLCIPQYHVC